jgi:Apea-like HEPN
MIDPKTGLTSKQIGVLNRCIREFFSKRAVEANRIEKQKELRFPDLLTRWISIDAKRGFMILLSDAGNAAHDRIVDSLHDAAIFGDDATRSDIWSAVRKTLESCIANKLMPEDSKELVDMIKARVSPQVRRYTFVAAVRGIALKGVKAMPLGLVSIVQSPEDYVLSAGVKMRDDLSALMKPLHSYPCIVGTFKGTFEAAKRKFSEQAHLTAAMLSVSVGEAFEYGATNCRVAALIDRPVSGSLMLFLHWDDVDKSLGWTRNAGFGIPYTLDKERVDTLLTPGPFTYAFKVFQNRQRTDLEEAIAKAVYWYGDAQLDPLRVGQFVKYWSCIESFFTQGELDITETLALGMVVVLTFGHLQYLDRADYKANKATLKKLYAKRSRAVHSASYSHITGADVALLSQWTAWLIFNVISFANADLPDKKVLLKRVKELDTIEGRRSA